VLNQKEIERLLNLLCLSGSTNDNEALLALRTANKMLASHNLDWRSFFGVKSEMKRPREEPRATDPKESRGYSYSTAGDPFEEYCNSAREKIRAMLDLCLNEVEGDALEFIESLEEYFNKRGTLTDKQLKALEKFYGNCYNKQRRGNSWW